MSRLNKGLKKISVEALVASKQLSSGTRPTLHIIYFSTHHEHSNAMLECWNRWIHSMVAFDNSILYEFHPRTHVLNASGTGRHNDKAWLAAMHHKIYAIHDFLRDLPAENSNDAILYTDTDVVPLGSYSKLLAPGADIQFMEEPAGSKGLSEWKVNAGFFLLRPTRAVRGFVAHWRTRLKMNRKLHDQDLANWLLLKHPSTANLSWSTFDTNLVTGQVSQIGATTVAYHAIGVTGEDKYASIGRAIKRRQRKDGISSPNYHHCLSMRSSGEAVFLRNLKN